MSDDPSTDTSPDWMRALTEIPADMAARVLAVLPSGTLEGYQTFLNMMYFYTLVSEDRLRDAAARTELSTLRAFYEELASEEAPHYLLAKRDLATFQRTPTDEKPEEVATFEAAWASFEAQGELARLGALYVLESVADHVAAEAPGALARLGITPEQASFILVHLEADEEHGAQCVDLCARLGERDPDALLYGARAAADAWVGMHMCLGT